MARRSVVDSDICKEVQRAVKRAAYLYLYDQGIPFDRLFNLTFDPLRKAYRTFQNSLPADVNSNFHASHTSEAWMIYPCNKAEVGRANSVGSTAVRNGATGALMYERHLWTYPQYRDFFSLPQETMNHWGVAFEFGKLKEPLPLSAFMSPGYHQEVYTSRYGLTLHPGRITNELYVSLQDRMRSLVETYRTLRYMQEYTEVICKHITTPGICAKIWPEAELFLEGNIQQDVRHAKPSQYPKGFREMVAHHDVTYTTIHKQLKAITDMVMASKLMPQPTSYEDQQECGSLIKWHVVILRPTASGLT